MFKIVWILCVDPVLFVMIYAHHFQCCKMTIHTHSHALHPHIFIWIPCNSTLSSFSYSIWKHNELNKKEASIQWSTAYYRDTEYNGCWLMMSSLNVTLNKYWFPLPVQILIGTLWANAYVQFCFFTSFPLEKHIHLIYKQMISLALSVQF